MQRTSKIAILFALALSTMAPVVAPAVPHRDTTVYVTKTGSKYHRDGCQYLRRSRIAISLNEAKKSYTPCSVCRPPQ